MDPSHQLGALQHRIMRVLWRCGEATAGQVQEALGKDRAPTTIATMLQKMERKGVVTHRREGRQFVYRPLVSEGEVKRSMVAALCERLFGGDAAELAHHLLDEQQITPDELERLRQRIEEAE